jgi:nitrate/nitrite-specific signal transduction histidine kinase
MSQPSDSDDRAALLARIQALESEMEDMAMIHETTLDHANALENDLIELVETLTKTATGLEAGVFDPELLRDLVERPDELGQLGRAFQAMGREVSARDQRLRMLRVVIPAGVALSAEKDFDQLLETLVIEAQTLCNADGGVLYLVNEDETELQAVIVRNNSLDIAMGGKKGGPVTLEPVPLYTEDGQPNLQNVMAHVALKRTRISVPNAYTARKYDFTWAKEFDARMGYRSQSFLAIPLTGEEDQVIGVLQLSNAREKKTGELIPFVVDDVIDTLVLLASAALSSYRREEKLRNEIVELQIKIDSERRAKEVAEVTGTDYFQHLQAESARLRNRKRNR